MSPSTFEEDLPKTDFASPKDYGYATAKGKFDNKIAELMASGSQVDVLIAADTIIDFKGEVLEKPRDEAHAVEMHTRLNGQTHDVYTTAFIGIFETHGEERKLVDWDSCTGWTSVTFAERSEEQIKAYVATGDCYGKAGGYGCQGVGSSIIERTDGCFYNMWGFPLNPFCKMFEKLILKHYKQ